MQIILTTAKSGFVALYGAFIKKSSTRRKQAYFPMQQKS